MKSSQINESVRLIQVTLHKELMHLVKKANELDGEGHLSDKAAELITDHFTRVAEIIRTHMMLSYPPKSNSSKKPGNQPKIAEREFFREIVTKHQYQHGPESFPSWTEFAEQIDEFNIHTNQLPARIKGFKMPEIPYEDLNISERTYENFKNLWRNQDFDL